MYMHVYTPMWRGRKIQTQGSAHVIVHVYVPGGGSTASGAPPPFPFFVGVALPFLAGGLYKMK